MRTAPAPEEELPAGEDEHGAAVFCRVEDRFLQASVEREQGGWDDRFRDRIMFPIQMVTTSAAAFLLSMADSYPLFLLAALGYYTGTLTLAGLTEIDPAFRDGLLGLDAFSHIIVCYWLHENDTPAGRSRLQLRPRKNPANPLTGVFATHSPRRPNPIAMTLCRLVRVEGTTLHIEDIDAFDGSPVIDIKCYIPYDRREIQLPDWV